MEVFDQLHVLDTLPIVEELPESIRSETWEGSLELVWIQ